jgi:hypothetical protein
MDMAGAAAELQLLAARLADAGETGLREELLRAVTDSAAPAVEAVRQGLPAYMPDPYAAVLEPDLQLSVRRGVAAQSTPSVRITARAGSRKIRRLEGGVLAHPLFGDRKKWFNQTSHVVAGFFSGPISKQAPAIRERIQQAVDRTAAKVTRST